MLAPTIRAGISSRIRRLKNDESGNIAVIFVLALLPVMGSVGMAVDYSRANSVRTAMQAAVDSTALALAKNASSLSSTQLTQQATDRFSALFIRPEATGVQINAQYD